VDAASLPVVGKMISTDFAWFNVRLLIHHYIATEGYSTAPVHQPSQLLLFITTVFVKKNQISALFFFLGCPS